MTLLARAVAGVRPRGSAPGAASAARERRRARATARRQRRLDTRQQRRSKRVRRRAVRQDRRHRAWARFQPYALAVLAMLAFITAGASTGLLLDAGTRALGVTLVVGGLFAAAGLLALEWRIRGE